MDAGFVRYSHRRCEDCDIREDLHASGSPLPKRRSGIARCQTCGGKGEIPLDRKAGVDPYAGRVPQGRAQFYEAKRAKRAHAERHRFRAKSFNFEECDEIMQIPPGGFNYGRKADVDEASGWRYLESQSRPSDSPSFKRVTQIESIRHGTRYGYQRRECRCFECRRWNAERVRSQRAYPQIHEEGIHLVRQEQRPGVPGTAVQSAQWPTELGASPQPTYLDAA